MLKKTVRIVLPAVTPSLVINTLGYSLLRDVPVLNLHRGEHQTLPPPHIHSPNHQAGCHTFLLLLWPAVPNAR